MVLEQLAIKTALQRIGVNCVISYPPWSRLARKHSPLQERMPLVRKVYPSPLLMKPKVKTQEFGPCQGCSENIRLEIARTRRGKLASLRLLQASPYFCPHVCCSRCHKEIKRTSTVEGTSDATARPWMISHLGVDSSFVVVPTKNIKRSTVISLLHWA